MKDIFNKRQRFSLRKYSVGVCSVLLGTALFAAGAQSASADEATVAPESAGTATSGAQPAATESSQAEVPVASKAYGEGAPAPKVDLSNSATTSEAPAPSTEKAEVIEKSAASEDKEVPAETKKEEKAETKKSEEAPKSTAPLETSKPVEKKKGSSSKPVSTPVLTTAQPTTARSAAVENSETSPASESSEAPTAISATVNPVAPIIGAERGVQVDRETAEERSASLDRAATDLTNAGALVTSRSRRSRRAVYDHNGTPVEVTTYLKPGETAAPSMFDANGATVSSQPVPAGYSAKEGDWYTYSIVDLTRFNERYHTNYYTRAYKRFDASTDTTVELIDKNTGNVVETRTITASSGIQKFTTTKAASNGELTWQVDFDKGLGAGPGKTNQPFIQLGYEVGASIQALVAPGHNLTPDEKKLYDAVYAARTSTDIINVVEPAYNGRTITDTNAKIPVAVEKTTYYRVVDENNPTFNANKTDKTVQDYVPNGNEVDLARYTLKAMEGQNFTASGERQFAGYKLYQTADANDQSGYVSRPYTVGTKFMDAERAGIKRIKEIVGEDGTVVVRVYLLDPKQQSKRSDGTLSTDGYMLLAETKPIKPGDYNKEDLVVKKSPLNTIAFTDSKGVNYPNGKEVPFDFQTAAGYTPKKTVFVPFLGDNIGHLSPNEQLVRGVNGIGTNVDLLNSLTPYKQPIYYYVKQKPVEVTPEVEKQLEGRVLVDGEFTFKIKENQSNKSLPAYEETVTNKADGKATFSKLSFNKVGTYTYTITETAGSDTNVDYDEMTVTMTVNVTENSNGDLEATVKYSAEGGFKSSEDDKIFNNYVVAPVKTKFDFSKALAGRELKAGEFNFVLKDSTGKTLQTKTNTKEGVVAFDDLTFDNTQVGTHKYTVEEVIPENKEAGMTYDTMKAEVTITVTKEGHVLKATNTLPSDTEFNNTFTPAATQAQFKFTKKLEGKELTKDAFTFELLENGNIIQTKKNAADGTIQFDAIEYNAVGEHTYTVREVAGTDKNIDYDDMNAVVTVNVTKNASTGILTANVTMPADTEFNNYVVAPVVTRFDFTKKLAGRKLKAGEFSFVLKDQDGKVIETVKNDAEGNVTFTELSYDNTKIGTHSYSVEEVIPADADKEFGMTYDTMKAFVRVTVAKNGHTLTTVTDIASTGGKNAAGESTDTQEDTEFNNKVTPPETPEFQPEKFVVSKEKYDITGNKLMNDDDELTNEYTETNADPYVDKTTNNEPENLNTKTVKRGSKLVYQVWLDTTKFTEANNIQYVGVSDTYDADKLDVNAADIKAYDSVTGAEVTNKFDIKVENGTITATSKEAFIKDKVNAPVIDTTKFEFGRYYKFDIPATVKESVKAGADIENTANQTVHVYNPVSKKVEKPEKPTQKRVNSVPVPVEMNFTKRLEGRELQAKEFEFVLKKDGVEVERVKNDAAGKIVFKTLEFGRDDLGKTYNYTVEETPGADATVNYDTMVATVKVVVSHDGTAKAIVANVTDAADKEFNNRVTPPEEPKFQPEKYVVSKEKYDITGDKLVDDDKELADKYADTNANPYADNTINNEVENLNTKTVERGSKLVYQVWLDTTKFDAANKDNIQSVGISDDYDETKLDLDSTKIKAYDSVTGAEVTDKFDITVNNGVITATLKDGFTKSLGDADNTQVIDTTKFAFGRYYKFDIPTTVKADVPGGVDIENTAAQVVNYYNPTTKKVEKPSKPTEKRVNNVPVEVEFNFTKRLEGRELKANEFSFVLKDKDGVVVTTVTNDANGNIKFTPIKYTNKEGKEVTALEFKRGEEGTYIYHVEEIRGTDSSVVYDKMVATVTVTVTKDGKVLTATSSLPVDTEFNNKVTPPTPPTPPTPTTPPAPALPETGEEQSASAALLGAALGMVGLAGLAKRKKRED